jgi:hypothetical protein
MISEKCARGVSFGQSESEAQMLSARFKWIEQLFPKPCGDGSPSKDKGSDYSLFDCDSTIRGFIPSRNASHSAECMAIFH